MAGVATGHGENFPHKFDCCPKCFKKGLYKVPQKYERCKYCGYMKLSKSL